MNSDKYNLLQRSESKLAVAGATDSSTSVAQSLSLFFASLCVIDLFGVFPIIALPKSIISCGLYGLPLMLFVITLQIYTAVILGRCWVIAEKLEPTIVHKNRYPYAAIAHLTYGKHMSLFVTILLDVTVFGGGIPNILVASQNLQLLGSRVSHGSFEFSFCIWLLIIGVFLCPIMLLGSPKNMKLLASTSVLICTSVAILTWLCIIDDSSNLEFILEGNTTVPILKNDFQPFKGLKLEFPPLINLLKTYGIIAFQFDIHPMLLTIEVDMQEKYKIGRAVCNGIFATCLLSIITTFLAAYRYGDSTTPNVLQMLPPSWTLYAVILLVTLQLCLSSVVGNSALFQHVEDMFGASRYFSIKRCIIRSTLVWLAVIIGELVPHFDVVMGLIGGTLTGPLIFILPPLFYTKIVHLEKMYDEELLKLKLDRESSQDDISNVIERDMMKKYKGYGVMVAAQYGSLQREREEENVKYTTKFFAKIKNIWQLMYSDCILSIAVIIFGLGATFTSTYYNIFDMNNSFIQFWSPCLANLTAKIAPR